MRELWKTPLSYRIGHVYVQYLTKTTYKPIRIHGIGNFPEDGAVIVASNHCNTMMDPIVLLQCRKGPVSFGARADIFRNPTAAWWLNWLKIVPLARQKDGAKAVEGNHAIFDKVVETILKGVPFCIFPEGTHRAKHSLMPLKKGVFRIAIQACRESDKPVYVLPAGIEYGDYYRFRTTCDVSFGEPIDVRKALKDAGDNDAEAMTAMLETLNERMKSLILWFPDDENYEKAYADYVVSKTKARSRCSKVLRRIAAVLSLPVAALLGLMSIVEWLPAELIVRRMDDHAWNNTVRYSVRFLALPISIALVASLSFNLLPWPIAAALTLLSLKADVWFYDLINFYAQILDER